MRKEFLILETNTKEERNSLIAHFKEAIEFSSSCKLSLSVLPLLSFKPRFSQYLRRLGSLRRLSRQMYFLDCTQTTDHQDLLGVRLSETGQVGA